MFPTGITTEMMHERVRELRQFGRTSGAGRPAGSSTRRVRALAARIQRAR